MKLTKIKEFWDKFQFILTKSQKRWGVVLLIMTLIGAVFETLGVSAILPLVQVMTDPETLKEYFFTDYLIDIFNISTSSELLWAVGIMLAAIYIIKNLYLTLLSYVRIKFSCKIQRETSVTLMKSYMKGGYSFFLDNSTGDLLRGMTNSIDSLYQALYQVLKIFAEILTVICICVFIMITDFTMAIIVIALAVSCLIAILAGFRKTAKRCGDINYTYVGIINKTLLQAFQGIKEVLIMNKQKYFVDSYEEKFQKRQKGIVGQVVSGESPAFFIEAVCVTGLLIAVCFKATDAESAEMLIPQLAAFAVAAFRILPSLGRISASFNLFLYCIPGINDTYDNLKRMHTMEYEEGLNDDIAAGVDEDDKERYLSVKNISWHYNNSEQNILEDVSIEIKKGEAIAFVGASGSGKTTMADVILGLLHPQQGRVIIEGENILEIPEKWSRMIGYVPQDAFLIDDTIRNNVAFGVASEEIDDVKVWRALERAQLKDFVSDLDNGLETYIGERGVRFSGGQCQRIAIARALYYDPDILVLDEATSALDTETETAVMEAIETLQGEKTLIIIAHRLTTIKNCDTIYRVNGGKVEQCEYDSLV